MMTIGEALKEERNKLGMSKYQFSKGIIDRKFYGEVEDKGKNIGSEALAKLLFKHGIDISAFFSKLESDYAPNSFETRKSINKKIDQAVKHNDLETIKECSDRILKMEGKSVLWLRSKVIIAHIEGNIDKLPEEIINSIYSELDKHENISTDFEAIRLFSNAMLAMDIERVNYFIKIILEKVKKQKLTSLEEERIARLCNNFINLCKENNFKASNVEMCLDYLNKLEDIHFLIYKMVGKFDYEILNGHVKAAIVIKKELLEFGYADISQNLKINRSV